jgi:hypothetical protein
MPTYDELLELARMCWRQSTVAQTEGAARELRRMAYVYRQAAAKLDSGKLSSVGEPRGDDKPPV